MSKSDPTPSGYTLHVHRQGAVVTVCGEASVDLFDAILAELISHPDFRPDLPAVWDMREARGFGRLSRAELSNMVMLSRRARSGSSGYRIAMVAKGDLDYGVGRMLSGASERADVMEVGIFFDMDEAKAWAFGGGTEDGPTAGSADA